MKKGYSKHYKHQDNQDTSEGTLGAQQNAKGKKSNLPPETLLKKSLI